MRACIIAFFIGTLSLFYIYELPSFSITLTVFIIALVIFIKLNHYGLKLIIAFLLGIAWLIIYCHWQLNNRLPNEWLNQSINITGIIASLPIKHNHYQKFNFNIESINGEKYKSTAQISWYDHSKKLKVGDEWQLRVKLKRPRNYANPGGFNYAAWTFAEGINAIGYVQKNKNNQQIGNEQFQYLFQKIRQAINKNMMVILQHQSMQGMITALSIGERSKITPEQWHVLQVTGTNHLMAISGLHIGLIAGLIYAAVFFLWRCSTHLCLFMPAQFSAALFAMIAAIFYAGLAGFAIPTQRALIMVMCFMLAIVCKKIVNTWHAWCLALFLVILINPLSSLSPGFWLSFCAVAIILYGTSSRYSHGNMLWSYSHVQWVVCVGLIPLTILFFQQFSIVSFIANLIAIPWVSFIVVPLSLLGSILSATVIGDYLLTFAAQALSLLWLLLIELSQWSWSYYVISINHFYLIFALAFAIALLLAPTGWPGRSLSVIAFLPIITFKPPDIAEGSLRFSLLDVGQGLSAVIQTKHHVLVYDTGARFSESFNMGAAVILPYLQTQHIQKINRIIISHPDNDHIGGLQSLTKNLPVDEVISSMEDYRIDAPFKLCHAGQTWVWDGVIFEILYPFKDQVNRSKNDHSCVLKITVGEHRILLPGDIERAAEQQLTERSKALLAADILIAPHHGSKTSSTRAFINAVDAQYVLFATGYLNRYRFPHQEVVNRYNERQAVHYNTADTGAIIFDLIPEQPIAMNYFHRKQKRAVWD